MQTREVNGVREVWDDNRQCWRTATWRDLQEKWPTQPPIDKTKFLCPTCGELVQMVAVIDGYEVWTIDPENGERVDIVESETTNVHEETFRCSSATCNWEAGYSWWEKINYGEQEEEEEPQVVTLDIETKDPIQPGLFDTKYMFWPPPRTTEVQASRDLWPDFWSDVKITVGKPDKT